MTGSLFITSLSQYRRAGAVHAISYHDREQQLCQNGQLIFPEVDAQIKTCGYDC